MDTIHSTGLIIYHMLHVWHKKYIWHILRHRHVFFLSVYPRADISFAHNVKNKENNIFSILLTWHAFIQNPQKHANVKKNMIYNKNVPSEKYLWYNFYFFFYFISSLRDPEAGKKSSSIICLQKNAFFTCI